MEVVHKLVKSIPNRIQALLKARGGYTNYYSSSITLIQNEQQINCIFRMFCNVFNAIQWGSFSHNIMKSKVPKEIQHPKFTLLPIYCWFVSPITMEIDIMLATYFI